MAIFLHKVPEKTPHNFHESKPLDIVPGVYFNCEQDVNDFVLKVEK